MTAASGGRRRTAPPAPNARRRARHILDNSYVGPARDPEALEIWGYTDRFGYRAGERLALRVSTTAALWDLEIARDGVARETVLLVEGLKGSWHETPEDCSVTGCGWPVAHAFTIPEHWLPGGYLVTLTGRRGSERVEEHHLFVLRRSAGAPPAPVLLLCATGTWVAYNCWGGSNAYEGLTGPEGNRFSPVLSTRRPWTRGFCRLPEGAPRTLPETPPQPGAMARYPYQEWAYAHGYSKKYASAGWASYERHFARWAEAAGYGLDIATLHDLHADPGLLEGYRCAVMVGHDEYWSGAMRDAMDAWIEDGGRAARFAGNFLWQIRLEEQESRQVCYKYTAREADPVMGTAAQNTLTGAWEMPEIGRPGALTFGVNGLRGIYAGLGHCVARGAGGFTIYRPQHWAFAGTHLGYGDVLGASSRIFGYEVDGLDYEIRDGLPFPTGRDGAAPQIAILGLGLATAIEADHRIWGQTLYIGDDDGAWKAGAMAEEPESAGRGSGMMISWRRGAGEVFTAATCEWVMGLARGDRQVERVTKNVLDRFTAQR